MIWKIVYTQKAKQDLDDVYYYIANVLCEPGIAKTYISNIMKEICGLNQLPMRYRIYDDEPWKSIGLRVMPVKNYLVFYLPIDEDKTVNIVRIMYAGRDISNQLEE
ncbi:MAG: type II toxin-antitoxin system RelE/ParE family toxin [Clostridia bacterium]|nr:type II toxin-antitoxin system RelE/ParE family toxin [Clostridia bacterium]